MPDGLLEAARADLRIVYDALDKELAQQLAKPVIGFLHSASPGQYVGHLAAFCQGLSEVGSSRETM
jgi:hypothetical protein